MQRSLFTELPIAEQETLSGGAPYYTGYRAENYRDSNTYFTFPKYAWDLKTVYKDGYDAWQLSPKKNYGGGGGGGGGY